MYEILFAERAKKEFFRLSTPIQQQLSLAIEKLKHEPRNPAVKKLKGSDDFYRLKSGSYRVIYTIEDKKLWILIVRVSHRKSAYRTLSMLKPKTTRFDVKWIPCSNTPPDSFYCCSHRAEVQTRPAQYLQMESGKAQPQATSFSLEPPVLAQVPTAPRNLHGLRSIQATSLFPYPQQALFRDAPPSALTNASLRSIRPPSCLIAV